MNLYERFYMKTGEIEYSIIEDQISFSFLFKQN